MYTCEYCGYTTKTKSALEKHLNRKYKCYEKKDKGKSPITQEQTTSQATQEQTNVPEQTSGQEQTNVPEPTTGGTSKGKTSKSRAESSRKNSSKPKVTVNGNTTTNRFETKEDMMRHIKEKFNTNVTEGLPPPPPPPPPPDSNGNTIHTTRNITINVLGKESLVHMLGEYDTVEKLLELDDNCVYGIPMRECSLGAVSMEEFKDICGYVREMRMQKYFFMKSVAMMEAFVKKKQRDGLDSIPIDERRAVRKTANMLMLMDSEMLSVELYNEVFKGDEEDNDVEEKLMRMIDFNLTGFELQKEIALKIKS